MYSLTLYDRMSFKLKFLPTPRCGYSLNVEGIVTIIIQPVDYILWSLLRAPLH